MSVDKFFTMAITGLIFLSTILTGIVDLKTYFEEGRMLWFFWNLFGYIAITHYGFLVLRIIARSKEEE